MSFLLFLAILILTTAVTVVLRHIERLARDRKAYQIHRRLAKMLFWLLLAVVGILETLLRLGIVSFLVPSWLYGIHVASAICFLALFLAKYMTGRPAHHALHARLSEPFWSFWWLTGGTALVIGVWNALVS